MERDAMMATLADLLRDLATGTVTVEGAAGRLVEIASTATGNSQLTLVADGRALAPPKTSEKQRLAAAISKVFEHWRTVTDRPKATLTPQRASKIRSRLREGRTVRDLVDAIDGAMMSEHHVQGNFTDLVTILKNATAVEQHLERRRGTEADQRAIEREISPTIRLLREQMDEAKKRGDRAEWKRLREELRRELAGG